jgi:hypothetical protein
MMKVQKQATVGKVLPQWIMEIYLQMRFGPYRGIVQEDRN